MRIPADILGKAAQFASKDSNIEALACVSISPLGDDEALVVGCNGADFGAFTVQHVEGLHEQTLVVPPKDWAAKLKGGKNGAQFLELDSGVCSLTRNGQILAQIPAEQVVKNFTYPDFSRFFLQYREAPAGQNGGVFATRSLRLFHDVFPGQMVRFYGDMVKGPVFVKVSGQPDFIGLTMPCSTDNLEDCFLSDAFPAWAEPL